MIGVILAAGMAKRLRPLTDTKPKCLLEVNGRTLLERTVDAMQQAGISEFVVVTGYRGDMIRDYLTNLKPQTSNLKPQFSFLHNADYEHNNNIYSLWMAGEKVRGKDFLLMDSDILCDPAAVVCIAQQQGSALAVNRHELGEEEMKVVVDADMRITEISKTCSPEAAMGESVGIERITADYGEALFRELDQMILKEGLIDIFYERAFERLIPQGHTFRVVDTTDFFSYEIDTPEDYERANDLFARFGNPQRS
ncbi:MAG: phosphocholine cytidylyltransferase family protein [Prevotella sp.]|nr:phosphocholine cytidylyltransferase family protein [Prevotella sp.]